MLLRIEPIENRNVILIRGAIAPAQQLARAGPVAYLGKTTLENTNKLRLRMIECVPQLLV